MESTESFQDGSVLSEQDVVWEEGAKPTSGKPTLGSRHIPQRLGMLVALAAAVAGIAVITLAVLARGGDGPSLDPAVEELRPANNAESVPVQSSLTIDLQDRPLYRISLRINGVPIPESEVIFSRSLNRLSYTIREGQTVEELRQGRNCAQAEFYAITEGPAAARTVNWCFETL